MFPFAVHIYLVFTVAVRDYRSSQFQMCWEFNKCVRWSFQKYVDWNGYINAVPLSEPQHRSSCQSGWPGHASHTGKPGILLKSVLDEGWWSAQCWMIKQTKVILLYILYHNLRSEMTYRWCVTCKYMFYIWQHEANSLSKQN